MSRSQKMSEEEAKTYLLTKYGVDFAKEIDFDYGDFRSVAALLKVVYSQSPNGTTGAFYALASYVLQTPIRKTAIREILKYAPDPIVVVDFISRDDKRGEWIAWEILNTNHQMSDESYMEIIRRVSSTKILVETARRMTESGVISFLTPLLTKGCSPEEIAPFLEYRPLEDTPSSLGYTLGGRMSNRDNETRPDSLEALLSGRSEQWLIGFFRRFFEELKTFKKVSVPCIEILMKKTPQDKSVIKTFTWIIGNELNRWALFDDKTEYDRLEQAKLMSKNKILVDRLMQFD